MSVHLNTYQFNLLKAIRYFVDKFGEAYPSVPLLAEMSGMCQRKAIDVIKELVEMGLIVKTPRYAESGGKMRQLSNKYEIVGQQEEAPVEEPEKTSHAPYIKAFIKSFKKELKDDDNNYRVTWFYDIAKEHNIPKVIADQLLRRIKEQLKTTSWTALGLAFDKLKTHAANISHFGSWFKETLINANLALKIAPVLAHR